MSTTALADSLYERLNRALPADQAYAPADWTGAPMPAPVHHYLTHLLRHQRRQEATRLRRARTAWVDYDHPEVEQATRTLLDIVEDHMRVPRDQWTETLRAAVQRTTDYLVRPVPTLTSFVFETPSGTVPVDQIQWRMRFFGPYAYLRNAVEAYAEKRDQDAFAPDVFERILRRVDERMTEDFDAERWGRLLGPLFDTAECATGDEELPLPLLRTFFEEKNASRLAERLAAHERNNGTVAIGPDTLRRLLNETAPSPSDPASAPPSASSPPLPSDLSPSEEAPSSSPSPSPSDNSAQPDASPSEPTPMWKQFEQDVSRRGAETRPNGDDSQPLWTQFRARQSAGPQQPSSSSSTSDASPSSSASSASASTSKASLSALERDVFGTEHPPNRSVYVRELFGGDAEAYREILERLRDTKSWSTASQIIASDAFRAHQVNIYSDAAVHFTNAVEAGFKDQ